MTKTKSSEELKLQAKEQLFGNYRVCISAYLVMEIITYAFTMVRQFAISPSSVAGTVMDYAVDFLVRLFCGVLVLGQTYLYLQLACDKKPGVSSLFWGFSHHPDRAVVVQFFTLLLTYLPLAPALILGRMLLAGRPLSYLPAFCAALILGGALSVFLTLMFSQSFYILLDFPDYTAGEALKYSRRIMKGSMARLFYIEIGFLPYYLLCAVTFGLGLLFVMPYVQATRAGFYLDLMQNENSGNP